MAEIPAALKFSFANLAHDFAPPELKWFFRSEQRKEFIPVKWMNFFKVLYEQFPRHNLLVSDFIALPDTIGGHNSPVVQTRYQQTTVPCTSYLLKRGLFDIFFPTDFYLFHKMYMNYGLAKHGKESLAERRGQVWNHEEFLTIHGGPEWCRKCETRSSFNPMLEDYGNNAFYTSLQEEK